jgi:hypothetical protein
VGGYAPPMEIEETGRKGRVRKIKMKKIKNIKV